MCLQEIERYSECRCIYYKSFVDKCPEYGQQGHVVIEKTVLVGFVCPDHDSRMYQDEADKCSTATRAASGRKNTKSKSRSITDRDWNRVSNDYSKLTRDDVTHSTIQNCNTPSSGFTIVFYSPKRSHACEHCRKAKTKCEKKVSVTQSQMIKLASKSSSIGSTIFRSMIAWMASFVPLPMP